MGILDLMLGSPGEGEQGVSAKSYTLPKETHDFVYPVAVRRAEVEAFAELLAAEADAPALEAESEELQDVLDGMIEEGAVDAEELTERMQGPRDEVEPVIGDWQERLEGDLDVVYARPGTYENLLAFVKFCKRRDDDATDEFTIPENFADAAALLKRLEEGTDTQYRAVIHTDLLPDE
ncbi:hypothetical protein A6E15_13380 [Natrinema saccharevitans]|uniref:Uncharacterized protein n=1 Tax=Natrinema saccharevitans TaxID=301967 RepID=A0A1S8AZ43_9EURY|nr:hypothetical protein [Natrinema saccharevitans]OLZ41912.1 hypothetical protein A6E15_13380 [Natrinema saccharevitans]